MLQPKHNGLSFHHNRSNHMKLSLHTAYAPSHEKGYWTTPTQHSHIQRELHKNERKRKKKKSIKMPIGIYNGRIRNWQEIMREIYN